jgi:hypothetical protein
MKKILLICMVFATGTILKAQTIQLPGTGSTNITVPGSQINASSQLKFSNTEYHVVGFTLKFPTNSNPVYVATSSDDHFTDDMLSNIPQLVSGSDINLQVTLQAPGEGHESWQKSYVVQLAH